jgi:hypothetical protein
MDYGQVGGGFAIRGSEGCPILFVMTAIVALICFATAQRPEPVLGTISYRILDDQSSKVIRESKLDLHLSDFTLTDKPPFIEKSIPLGDHFLLKLPEMRSSEVAKIGFGLVAERDDMKTFCWEWFNAEKGGRATKLQESGELKVKFSKVGNGVELTRMEFLTDISLRLNPDEDAPGAPPKWRVDILKGSVINWPALVGGKVLPIQAPRGSDNQLDAGSLAIGATS